MIIVWTLAYALFTGIFGLVLGMNFGFSSNQFWTLASMYFLATITTYCIGCEVVVNYIYPRK